VKTGIADTHHRVITDGLAAGDVVILFPGSTINNGLRVTARVTD
jgi:hypothetical protein